MNIASRFAPFRRTVSLAALLLMSMLLVACASKPVPPEPVSLRSQQETILRDLGFVEIDDGWMLTIAEPISFELNKSDVNPTLHAALMESAARLSAVKITELRCEGHTDNRGAYEYNAALSLARGRAVADVFIEAGFPPETVTAVGHASDYPIDTNDTREGRAANRRVNIIVPAQSLSID